MNDSEVAPRMPGAPGASSAATEAPGIKPTAGRPIHRAAGAPTDRPSSVGWLGDGWDSTNPKRQVFERAQRQLRQPGSILL